MKLPNFLDSYKKLTSDLLGKHGEERGMSLAVGGDFEAVGMLEYFLLLQHGLQRHHSVVDVGCGSGRLAVQLREYLSGRYTGIDVVPELFRYAQRISNRPDWKFYTAPGLTIPEPDNSADFICFFSVFTHLLHEESYKYLEDARRVLKPGGKIVLSFLEFLIPAHWYIFQGTLANMAPGSVLNQFMDRDAIRAWAAHLNLTVVEIADGDKVHIPLPKPVTWDDGRVFTDLGYLGQSVCVLSKSL